jgi:hypothetical protein
MSDTLDFISTAALPGTHIFLQNVNNLESASPRCTGYSDARTNSLPSTPHLQSYTQTHLDLGIQLWGTASNSNIEILERFQSKVLRLIVNAPWYVPNSVISKDLRIPSVKAEISRFGSHYDVHISVHPNELIASLTEPPIHRRLRRYWPHDLLTIF